MSNLVFDHVDYKKYLTARLPTHGKNRGRRAKLAEALGCRSAFISQVMNGPTHFSLEHAALIDRHLEHNREESRYFMLLVHHGRAGSKILRDQYQLQMTEILKQRQIVAARVQSNEKLNQEFAQTYYRSWYYSAIHILLLISKFQTRTAIAERLKLPLSVVSETIDFLVRSRLAEETRDRSDRIRATNRRLHLGEDSLLLAKHHLNWRTQALASLDRKAQCDLHYSGPMALTEENAEQLKLLLLNSIENSEEIIARPGEDDIFCLSLDFFRV